MGSESVIEQLSALNEWYQRPFGVDIKCHIASHLRQALSKLDLQEALWLGVPGFHEANTGEGEKWARFFSDLECVDWLAEEDYCLPLKTESQECVVLVHGLDIAANPHTILRELARITQEDGHLVIIGFNPVSLLGLYKPFGKWFGGQRGRSPSQLEYYRLARLRDWLELLSFQISNTKTISLCPYIKQGSRRLLPKVIDTGGLVILPGLGNVYVVIAKKRTIPMTPIKMKWRTAPATTLLKSSLPKASASRVNE